MIKGKGEYTGEKGSVYMVCIDIQACSFANCFDGCGELACKLPRLGSAVTHQPSNVLLRVRSLLLDMVRMSLA